MNRALAAATALICFALVALSFGAARPAEAGEKERGQIAVLDGGSATNLSTAVSFALSSNKKVAMQAPDAGVWFSVEGLASCPANYPCVYLPPPSMISDTPKARLDGGVGALITIHCEGTSAACILNVFDLDGNE